MSDSKQTQKDAVFSAVTSVLSEAGVSVNEGENFAPHLIRELRSQVTNILVEGFTSGSVDYDGEVPTGPKLRTYCSGLTSNWLRKDKRLNGNTAYIAKNPGSRVGSSDVQLKAMRALLNTKNEHADREQIQGFIDLRVAEIKASRKPVKEINVSDLPAELRHMAE